MTWRSFFAALSLISAVACNQSNSSSGGPSTGTRVRAGYAPSGEKIAELSAQQKSDFSLAMADANRVNRIAGQYQTKQTETRGMGQSSPQSVRDAKVAETIQKAVQNGTCVITTVAPSQKSGGGQITSGETRLTIGGGACPFRLENRFNVAGQSQGSTFAMSLDFNMTYAISNSELAQLNDFTSMQFQGKGTMNGSSDDQTQAFAVDLKGAGKFASMTLAEVGFEMETQGSILATKSKGGSGGIGVSLLYTMPGFKVLLQTIFQAESDRMVAKYFLNGREISDAEFRSLTGGTDLPFPKTFGFNQ